MYKNVARRVLAVMLTFCMIGSVPDFTLFAAGTGGVYVDEDANLQNISGDDNEEEDAAIKEDDSESRIPEEEDPEKDTEYEDGGTPLFYTPVNQLQDVAADSGESSEKGTARAGNGSLSTAPEADFDGSTANGKLPNQVEKNFPVTGAGAGIGTFVSSKILGLKIVYQGTTLEQRLQEDSTEDGYKVYYTRVSGNTMTLTLRGSGVYDETDPFRSYSQVRLGKNIEDCTVTFSYDGQSRDREYYYEGRPINFKIEVRDGSNVVSESNYEVPELAGEFDWGVGSNKTITIRGKEEYGGERTETFSIVKSDVSALYEVINYDRETVFNKAKAQSSAGILPSNFQIKKSDAYGGGNPSGSYESVDYAPGNPRNTDRVNNMAHIDILGKVNCEGQIGLNYSIVKADFDPKNLPESNEDYVCIEVTSKHTYNGSKQFPTVRVYQKDASGHEVELIKDTEYTIDYGSENENIEAGTGKITVRAADGSNYTGSREVSFDIGKYDIGAGDFETAVRRDLELEQEYSSDNPCYDRGEIKPSVPDTISSISGIIGSLEKGKDYTVSFENNYGVGNGIILIKGTGNCTGEVAIDFIIWKYITDTDDGITIQVDDQQYTGKDIKPSPVIRNNGKLLTEGKDYEVVDPGTDWIDRGTYTIRVRGKGDYYRNESDSTYLEVSFRITARKLDTLRVEFVDPVRNNTFTFNGSAFQKTVKVVDETGKTEFPLSDFDITYRMNAAPFSESACKDAGEYQVRVEPKIRTSGFELYEPKANGESFITLPFTIQAKSLEEVDTEFSMSLSLNGADLASTPYTGESIPVEVTVLDKHRDMAGEYSQASVSGYEIKKSSAYPGDDYEISYLPEDHREVGRVVVTVTGKGNYTGTLSKPFQITKKTLAASDFEIKLANDTYTYTGEPIIPEFEIFKVGGRELTAAEIEKEFTLESSAVNAQKEGDPRYTFNIIGKNNYEGTVNSGDVRDADGASATFTIVQQDINASDVWVEPIPNQAYEENQSSTPVPVITYNGKELVYGEDKDFTLQWENNDAKDIGVTDPEHMPVVIITGKGNFKGERKVYFHIRESIKNAQISWNALVYQYISRELKPTPASITLDGQELKPETILRDENGNISLDEDGNYIVSGDYRVTWKNNINAASADAPQEERPTISITGINDYGGEILTYFTIEPILVTLERWANNGKTAVLKAPLTYTPGNNPMFTGSDATPALSIVYDVQDPITGERFKYKLVEGTDYDIISAKGIDASTTKSYDLTIRPKGNFIPPSTNMVMLGSYKIDAKPLTSPEIQISDIKVEAPVSSYPVKPAIVITDTKRNADTGAYMEEGGTYQLAESADGGTTGDYKLTWRNNDVPGTATVVIDGVNNYKGRITKTFVIPGDLNNATVSFLNSTCDGKNSGKYFYTGFEIKPQIQVTTTVTESDGSTKTETLRQGRDYEFELVGDRINCGQPEIRLAGMGAYAGGGALKIVRFTIVPVNLNDVSMYIAPSVEFIGNGINVWPGGNDYQGTEPNEAAENSRAALSLKLGRYTMQEGIDYICEHEDSCWQPSAAKDPANPYPYRLTIKPGTSGNFTGGPVEKTYLIGNNFNIKIEFKDAQGNWSNNYSAVYNESAIEPEIRVTDLTPGDTYGDVLTPGEDYSVTFTDNVNAGTVTVMVCGLAGQPGKTTSYCGIRTAKFNIAPMNLSDAGIITEAVSEEYTYTSKEIEPEPGVTWTDHRALIAGEDFEYRYANNINAGPENEKTGEVYITSTSANSNFTGNTRNNPVKFRINPKNIEDPDVILDSIPDQIYVDEEIEPALNIHWGEDDIKLQNPADYTQTYGEMGNKNVGTVDMQITGQGNYTGTVSTSFRIVPVKISDIILDYADQNPRYDEGKYPWTGKQIRPNVKLTYYGTDGKLREKDPEVLGCTVSYGTNQMVGTTSGTIRLSADPNGNCEGDDAVWYFGIAKRHITDPEIEMTGIKDEYKLDKDTPECKPVPVLTFTPDTETRYTMRLTEDYSLEWENYDQAGTAAIHVRGENNFDDLLSKEYIIANDLNDYVEVAEINPDALPIIYNGKRVDRSVLNLRFATNTIKEGETYTIEWDHGETGCINAGEHYIIIKANRGSGYTGEIRIPFTIEKCPISEVTFTIEDQEYIGSAIVPDKADIKAVDERISDDELDSGIYEITGWGENTNVGDTGTVTVNALEGSNYTGTADIEFAIVQADLEKDYIESSVIETQAYTGSEIVPEIVITDRRRNESGAAKTDQDTEDYVLDENDYSVEIVDNIYPGTATVTITGDGNYKGTITKIFDITADLGRAVIEPIPAQSYTGEEIRPKLTVRLGEKELIEDVDYIVVYADNIERGRASATIWPKMPEAEGLYEGSQTVYFDISRDLSGAQIQLIDTSFTYTGSSIEPVAAVVFEGLPLTAGVDYVIDYNNNVNVGTAEITVRGIGGYEGTVSMTFEIIRRSVVRCSYGNVTDKIYTGSPAEQDVVVTDGNRRLTLNQDYQVAYADHESPGVATLTVSGIGNYGGTKTIHYVIGMADVTEINARGSGDYVQLTWSAVPGAEGYTIYNANNQVVARTENNSYRHTGLNAMTTYTYKIRPYASAGGSTNYGNFSDAVQASTSIARPAVKLKAGRKKITVSWKKVGGVSGYEIYRSTKKSSGYKKIRTAKKAKITSYTNKKLVKNQKYFYRIRAYKTINGRKFYSSYSSPKSVKAK